MTHCAPVGLLHRLLHTSCSASWNVCYSPNTIFHRSASLGILTKIDRNRALAWLERRLFADPEIPQLDALEMLAKVDRTRAIAIAREAAGKALNETIGQSVPKLADASALVGLINRCEVALR